MSKSAFAAGAVAGGLEISCTMPLDTIKTQMQIRGTRMIPTVTNIFTKEGVRGFYFGLPAMICQVSAKAAIRFWAFENIKTLLSSTKIFSSASQINFISGMGAGIFEAMVLVTPTERLKVLRQNELNLAKSSIKTGHSSLASSIRTILSTQGPQGFFVGFMPTAARQGLAMGVRFMLYDEMKKLITFGSNETTAVQKLLAGMSTGTVSSLLNQPIDMAKTRIQAETVKNGDQARYKGTFDCLRSVLREEGISGWYRGCFPRVMRLTIGQGIIFSSQEQLATLFRNL